MTNSKNINKIFRQISNLTLVFMIIVILVIAFFLYISIYQTISQSKEIVLLRSEVILQSPDFTRCDQADQKFTRKVRTPNVDWATVRNPYYPLPEEELSN